MEPAQLQLAFNVVAITGVSSFASFWYLRRKDRELAAESRTESTPGHRDAIDTPESITGSLSAAEQDIRHFAADRRATWVQGMTRAISR